MNALYEIAVVAASAGFSAVKRWHSRLRSDQSLAQHGLDLTAHALPGDCRLRDEGKSLDLWLVSPAVLSNSTIDISCALVAARRVTHRA